jgi:decaprenylphospho-beta-D-erythro-pentofuranosid-2-ulose 2-reductase
MSRNVVILGATSAIAQAVARQCAARGDRLLLVARNAGKLEALRKSLENLSSHPPACVESDLTDVSSHPELIRKVGAAFTTIDFALVAHGILGDQETLEKDIKTALKILDANFVSAFSLLTLLANQMEPQKCGCLAAISSVAGDRIRRSLYVYGTTKGALNLFLEGLRLRLSPLGVRVLTIKPGFVDSPMTAHLKKNRLFASPDRVAADILQAVDRGREELYTPWFWKWIMRIICLLPRFIFTRLPL